MSAFNQWDFYEPNQKARKVVDNVHVILNKIHLALFPASLWCLFPLIYSWHLIILGSCYCTQQIEVGFLCICPFTEDTFCYNIA